MCASDACKKLVDALEDLLEEWEATIAYDKEYAMMGDSLSIGYEGATKRCHKSLIALVREYHESMV